jgi:energy-coupling factor transporter transmembrane protein EcfT
MQLKIEWLGGDLSTTDLLLTSAKSNLLKYFYFYLFFLSRFISDYAATIWSVDAVKVWPVDQRSLKRNCENLFNSRKSPDTVVTFGRELGLQISLKIFVLFCFLRVRIASQFCLQFYEIAMQILSPLRTIKKANNNFNKSQLF